MCPGSGSGSSEPWFEYLTDLVLAKSQTPSSTPSSGIPSVSVCSSMAGFLQRLSAKPELSVPVHLLNRRQSGLA